MFISAPGKIQSPYPRSSNPSLIWPSIISLTWPSTFLPGTLPNYGHVCNFQTTQVHLCHRTFECSYSLCLACSFFPEPQGSLPGMIFYQRGYGDRYLFILYDPLLTLLLIIFLHGTFHYLAHCSCAFCFSYISPQ